MTVQPTTNITVGSGGTTHWAFAEAVFTIEHPTSCASFGITKIAAPMTEKRRGLR
jgi:hypothetical protein